eukprot:701291-Pyramimonas_sp.AAC.1
MVSRKKSEPHFGCGVTQRFRAFEDTTPCAHDADADADDDTPVGGGESPSTQALKANLSKPAFAAKTAQKVAR